MAVAPYGTRPRRGPAQKGARPVNAARRRAAGAPTGGVTLTGKTGVNHSNQATPGASNIASGSTGAAARAGKRFKIGLDSSGRIVHIYSRQDVKSGPTSITLAGPAKTAPITTGDPAPRPAAPYPMVPPKGMPAPQTPVPDARQKAAIDFMNRLKAQNAPPAKGIPAPAKGAPASAKPSAASFSRKLAAKRRASA